MALRDTRARFAMGALEDAASLSYMQHGGSVPALITWMSMPGKEGQVLNAVYQGIDAALTVVVERTGWEPQSDGSVRLGKAIVPPLRKGIAELSKEYRALIADPQPVAAAMLQADMFSFYKRWEALLDWLIVKSTIGTDEEDYAQHLLRTGGACAVRTQSEALFPTAYDYTLEKHVPAPTRIPHRGEKELRKWQAQWKKGLDALATYFDYAGVKTLRPYREKAEVDGVTVWFYTQGFDERKAQTVMQVVQAGNVKIREAGLIAAARRLVVEVRFDDARGGDAAASYDTGLDRVVMRPWSLIAHSVQSYVHEVGHRFYYTCLTGKARAAWDEAVGKRLSYVDTKHVDDARPQIDRFFADAQEQLGRKFFDADGVTRMAVGAQWVACQPNLEPFDRARLRYIIRIAAGCNNAAQGWDSARFWAKEIKHRGVGLEPTHGPEQDTDYGAFNVSESFAESFRLYVLDGPRALGPWTRAFFRSIVQGGGGARLRYNPQEASA